MALERICGIMWHTFWGHCLPRQVHIMEITTTKTTTRSAAEAHSFGILVRRLNAKNKKKRVEQSKAETKTKGHPAQATGVALMTS